MEQKKYYFDDLKSSISNLSETELDLIVNDYESGTKAVEMKAKYPKLKSISLFKQLPYRLSEETCEYCSSLVYAKMRKVGYPTIEKLCLRCMHVNSEDCTCEKCLLRKQEKLDERRRKVDLFWRKFYAENYDLNFSLLDLSIFDEIMLSLLIESYASFELGHFDFSTFKKNWSFHRISDEYRKIIDYLIYRKILIPDLRNFDSNEPFYWPDNYVPDLSTIAYWILNIKNEKDTFFQLSEIKEIVKNRVYSPEQKEILWKEVYFSEIKNYVDNQAYKYLKKIIDDQIIDQFVDYIFPKFPLSKAYAIIFYTISSSLRYMTAYRVNDSKLNSYFRNKMNENILKYQDLQNLKDFNRPTDVELSSYSQYIIKYILKQENTYFFIGTDKVLENR